MKSENIHMFGCFNSTMYRGLFYVSLVALLLLISSCREEDWGDSYYTFTGQTIGEYLEHTDDFSEFYHLLDTTEVIGLLRAYGEYTCFVPDNESMEAFYKANGKRDLHDFSINELKKTAYHHIIQDTLATTQFIEGFQSRLTMSGRYLKIDYVADSTELVFVVNDSSTITTKDRYCHNGIVHVLNAVLDPSEYTIVEAISKDAQFSLFYEALMATELNQELELIEDYTYEAPTELLARETSGNDMVKVPRKRKYGYTVLMESNSTYAASGITTLEELKAEAKLIYDEVYPDDKGITDITDRRNSLNRFVAYHLMNKKIAKQYFIKAFDHSGMRYNEDQKTHSVQTYDMFEYIETMCPNTLLEVRTNRATGESDLFNATDVSEDKLTIGHVVHLTDNYDKDALNGVYHEIDELLSYNANFVSDLSSKRLRMNPASFFPEFTNNSIRVSHANSPNGHILWLFPKGYLERLSASEITEFGYFTAEDDWCNYQGDEVFMNKCMYDIEIETLPIPAGTYEVRFGYKANGNRGKAQLYWDGEPSGIPLDLSITGDQPKIDYVLPGKDAEDPAGFENDKMMRNRGYMKGPASFKGVSDSQGIVARNNIQTLRRILGTFTFTESSTHFFRAKGLSNSEFMFDFMEFVPTEMIDNEGVE